MKYTSIAVLAVLGLANAHRHHHHHHSLAQKEDKPAVTPDSNRANFEKSVKTASNVVAEEHRSENQRTSTHQAAMASQYAATFAKNAATRTKYNIENVENNVAHRQWVTRNNRSNWAQIEADAQATPDSNRAVFDTSVSTADAVVAKQKAFMAESDATIAKNQADAAAATSAKKNGIVASRINQIRGGAKNSRDSRGWRLVWPAGSLAQGNEGSPDTSAKARKQAVEDAAATTKIQRASEADNVATIAKKHEDAATDASEYSTNSKQQIDNVRRGGVHAARDALGWRMQTGSYDTINPAGYEPHVAQFVKPNIIYQSNDPSNKDW